MVLATFDPFVQFERQFGRLSQLAFGQGGSAVMPMDGLRRADEIVLRFDLPGIHPDSIQVTVDHGVLSVSAKRQEEYAENERLFIRERAMGSLSRRVYLPEHVNADAIEAAYTDGVLEIRIPVIEKAKPRKIEIQQAANGALGEAASTHAIDN